MTNKELLKRLYEFIKPYRVKLLIAMVAMIFVSIGTGAQHTCQLIHHHAYREFYGVPGY